MNQDAENILNNKQVDYKRSTTPREHLRIKKNIGFWTTKKLKALTDEEERIRALNNRKLSDIEARMDQEDMEYLADDKERRPLDVTETTNEDGTTTNRLVETPKNIELRDLNIISGELEQDGITIFHNNSIAEDVRFYKQNILYDGTIEINDGVISDNSIQVKGKSLIHSAELTSKAFGSGILGLYGEYIVAIGLLLFAFSTAIAWSYYGDRSTAYIFGETAVPWYRMLYVICFIAAAIIDTTVIWNIAYVVVALVTIPNLFAMFLLRKEMREQVENYVVEK